MRDYWCDAAESCSAPKQSPDLIPVEQLDFDLICLISPSPTPTTRCIKI